MSTLINDEDRLPNPIIARSMERTQSRALVVWLEQLIIPIVFFLLVLEGGAMRGGTSSVGMETTTSKRKSFFENLEQTAVDFVMSFRGGMDWCTNCAPTEPAEQPFHQDSYRGQYAVPAQHYAHFLHPQHHSNEINTTAPYYEQQQPPPWQEADQFRRSVSRVLESQNECVSFEINTSEYNYNEGDWPLSVTTGMNLKAAVKTSAQAEMKEMGPNPYSQIHSASGRARVPFVQQSYPSIIDNSKDKSLHLC